MTKDKLHINIKSQIHASPSLMLFNWFYWRVKFMLNFEITRQSNQFLFITTSILFFRFIFSLLSFKSLKSDCIGQYRHRPVDKHSFKDCINSFWFLVSIYWFSHCNGIPDSRTTLINKSRSVYLAISKRDYIMCKSLRQYTKFDQIAMYCKCMSNESNYAIQIHMQREWK